MPAGIAAAAVFLVASAVFAAGPSPSPVNPGPINRLPLARAALAAAELSSRGATIAVGARHAAVVGADGRLWTWGSNQSGQLGRPDGFGDPLASTTVPQEVPGITTAQAVAVSDDHTLVALADGSLLAFGADRAGQLGVAPGGFGGRYEPTPVSGIVGEVVAVAAGRGFSLALTADGTVWSFGANLSGELGRPAGLGTALAQPVPATVDGLVGIRAISAGAHHVLALSLDGSTWGFGSNLDGQLGFADGFRAYQPQPEAQRLALPPADAVAAGGAHSVVRLLDGSVVTFGANLRGQLGTSDDLFWRSIVPHRPAGLALRTPIGAGTSQTVAATPDGLVAVAGGTVSAFTATPLGFGLAREQGLPQPPVIEAVAGGPFAVLATADAGRLYGASWPADALPGPLTEIAGLTVMPHAEPVITPPFAAVSPARIVETRPLAQPTIDGLSSNFGAVAAGGIAEFAVVGRAGVAAGASAVSLNLTIIDPMGAGYATVFPCGVPPNASTVNFSAGQTIAAAALTKVSPTGSVCVLASVATHLSVDLTGWFPATGAFSAVTPARLTDTRPGTTTIDRLQAGGGVLAADSVLEVAVAGRGGVPADATSALLNVTVTGPASGGYLTVYPCDALRPTASNLNFSAGQTVANAVAARLSASGSTCVYTSARTHLIVDAGGSFDAAAGYAVLGPSRLLDSRTGAPTVDGRDSGGGPAVPESIRHLRVVDRAGVQRGATAVIVTVTAVDAGGPGYLTVFPCGTRPNASSLNFATGQTIANMVTAPVGIDGEICLVTSAPTDLIVDVNGSIS